MTQHPLIKQFSNYLMLHQHISPYYARCYCHDLVAFAEYLEREANGESFDFTLSVQHADAEILEEYFQHLREEGSLPTVVLRISTTLRIFFWWLYREGHITHNPFAHMAS